MRTGFAQESDFRQERDFGQKISATFEFMAVHWRPLGRVLLTLVLPAALLQAILSVVFQLQMHDTVTGLRRGMSGGMGGVFQFQRNLLGAMSGEPAYWVSVILGTAFFTVLVLSIYGYVLVLLHRQTPGPEVTVADVWAVVRREFLEAFFSSWGIFIIVGLGSLVLFIPGVYLGVALSLFFIVKLAEGSGFGATLSRCLALTKGKWWSTFGAIFIIVLMLYVVMAGVGTATVLLSGGMRVMLHASMEQSPVFTIVMTCLSSAFSLLLYPPLLLILAFQYFNLVERRDGVGLRRMLDSLGQTAPPQVHNATYQPDDEGEY